MDQELQYGVRTRRQVQQQQKMETKPSKKASAPRKKSKGGAKGHGKRAGPAYRGATPPLPDSPSEIAEDDQSTADSPGCLATTTSHARVGWPSPPQEDAVPPAAEVGGERLAAVPEAQLTEGDSAVAASPGHAEIAAAKGDPSKSPAAAMKGITTDAPPTTVSPKREKVSFVLKPPHKSGRAPASAAAAATPLAVAASSPSKVSFVMKPPKGAAKAAQKPTADDDLASLFEELTVSDESLRKKTNPATTRTVDPRATVAAPPVMYHRGTPATSEGSCGASSAHPPQLRPDQPRPGAPQPQTAVHKGQPAAAGPKRASRWDQRPSRWDQLPAASSLPPPPPPTSIQATTELPPGFVPQPETLSIPPPPGALQPSAPGPAASSHRPHAAVVSAPALRHPAPPMPPPAAASRHGGQPQPPLPPPAAAHARASSHHGHGHAAAGPPPPTAAEPSFFLILDTNQLLHEMDSLEALRREPNLTLVVPTVVLDELDHLKTRRNPDGSVSTVAVAAQRANRFLTPHYVDRVTGVTGGGGVLGQFPNERALELRVSNQDDKVLACAMYWHTELQRRAIDLPKEQALRQRGFTGPSLLRPGAEAHACLLTADENVKAKASLRLGVWANNATAFLQHLRHSRMQRLRAEAAQRRAVGSEAIQAAMAASGQSP